MGKEILLDVMPGVYMRREPTSATPVVFEIPRSGCEFPRWFKCEAPVSAVQKSASLYVEDLYRGVTDADATWLYACFPNVVIDANRGELDIDPAQLDGEWPAALQPTDKTRAGVGLIPMKAGNMPLYAGRVTVEDVSRRLNELYRPYHAELARILAAAKARFGAAYHLSCHSMGSVSPGNTSEPGQRRTDFDLGDRNGATCEPELREAVRECLAGLGYSVSVNRYFAGAEAVRKHGDPTNGIHSLQIEMNRDLYMDESNAELKPQLQELKGHLVTLAETVAKYAADRRARI